VLNSFQANYDILSNTAQNNINESESTNKLSFDLDLDRYTIEKGNISYRDDINSIFVEAREISHSGSGAFNESAFDLITNTEISQFSVSNAGIGYLANDKLDMDLSIGIDLANGKYKIKENDILLNALRLKANGIITEQGTGYNLNMKVAAPGNQFKELLSILPGAYTSEFSKVSAAGKFSLTSTINGLYDASRNQFPNIDLGLTIDDASFKYPGMGSGLSKLFTQLIVKGNLGNIDELKINADRFNFDLNNEPFVSNFILTKLGSNPTMNGALNGKIDFGFINQNFPMKGIQMLSGIFDAAVEIDASYQELETESIDQINLSGTADISNFIYDAEGLPAIVINTATAKFSPKSVLVNNLVGKYGKTDFKGNGQLDNFLAILLPNKTMAGKFDISSSLIDVDEIIGFQETQKGNAANSKTISADSENEVFDRFDFTIKAKVASLNYENYPITDMEFDGQIKPNAITINNTKGYLGKSDFAARGELNEIFNYLYNDGELKGSLDIGSKFFDLNEYMTFGAEQSVQTKTIADTDDYEAIILPERTDLDITARVKRLIYTDLKFTNAKGNVTIKNQVATLKKCNLNGLGGTMNLEGSYDSSSETDPKFDLDYGMQKVDFGKVFTKFVSWEKLAPLGKFLTGEFNTTLKFKGSLKDGFYPDLNSLSADGFLQTLDATLRAFPPIEKVANQLNISAFKNLRIRNTKNWFEVKNGKIEVKDFDFSHKGIDMVIGGSHGLTQDMDYKILATIPREMITGNQVGQLANQGLSFLAEKASKLGIKLDPGSSLNVRLNIGGTITKPTLKVDVLGTDGKTSIKDQVVNTVKETVNNAVDSVKTVVTDKVEEEKKALQAKMDKEIKVVMDLAEKQAKSIKETGKKAAAQAKKLGYDQADRLVQEAGNNFIKKKAAELAAKKIKTETDKKVTKIEDEANKKADLVMEKARNKVKTIQKKYQDL